jgi:hypothetical protein
MKTLTYSAYKKHVEINLHANLLSFNGYPYEKEYQSWYVNQSQNQL